MEVGKIKQLTESYSSREAALRGSRKAVVISNAMRLRNEIDQLLSGLPHGDRICELHKECTCGRDEIIQKVLEKLSQ
jgi:hypothetical protein